MFRETLTDWGVAGLVHGESLLFSKWHNYHQLKPLIFRASAYISSFTSLCHFVLIFLSPLESPQCPASSVFSSLCPELPPSSIFTCLTPVGLQGPGQGHSLREAASDSLWYTSVPRCPLSKPLPHCPGMVYLWSPLSPPSRPRQDPICLLWSARHQPVLGTE